MLRMVSWIRLLGLRRISGKGLFGLGKHRAVRVKNGLKDWTGRVEKDLREWAVLVGQA